MARLVPLCMLLPALATAALDDRAERKAGVRAHRALRMEAEARRAARRFGTEASVAAAADGLAVRYRGLFRLAGLALALDPTPVGAWALASFTLAGPDGPLRAPGIVEVDLAAFRLPPTPVRDPMAELEVYQELEGGEGWLQLPPVARDEGRRRLHVHRDGWGTGRFALASRFEQPPGLFARPPGLDPGGPEIVVLHGVDGARSDYSGPRDMLALAGCIGSRVWFFQYPSGLPIMDSALALHRELGRLRGFPPSRRRRILLGFSMGGLVARTLVEEVGSPVPIDEVVLLGTPSRGVEWPAVLSHLPFLEGSIAAVTARWPGVAELLAGSPLLRRLAAPRPARPVPRYLALAGIADGNGDLVVDADSVDLPAHRRPLGYRFRWRRELGNLNELSHWGIHQELMANGLGREIQRWLGLEAACPDRATRRRLRIERALDGLAGGGRPSSPAPPPPAP